MSAVPQSRLNRRSYPGDDWRSYMVTPHFRLGEFIRDQAEAPPKRVMLMCRAFSIRVLEPLRGLYGPGVIVSGHRTPAHNAHVGGAVMSWHVWEWHPGELAVDVVFRRGNPHLWSQAAEETTAGGIGIYRTHIHLDSRPDRVRWISSTS